MKRDMGLGRCGLACCLCSENGSCAGCNADGCPGASRCENRSCSVSRGISGCYECNEDCRKGLLSKIKPRGFTLFARRYGAKELLDCLEQNEKNGVIYHREGIIGDYDDFNDTEKLIDFIKKGIKL